MISPAEFYTVMAAMVPLYVAMLLAYASVRWWGILTPDQCSGINRFVAIFAVPLLSFQIIAHNNPYDMSLKFVLADALQKIIVLAVLGAWTRYSRRGSLEWMITLFMLATLPNTLVMGIPLLNAMYGGDPSRLVVQAVVLQCIVWYTLLLVLFEYRSAKILVAQKFPKPAAAIASVKADPDVVSLSFKEGLTTEASVGEDGKIYVQLKRSPPPIRTAPATKNPFFPPAAMTSTAFSSKASTPGASDLSNAEIYSVHSSSVLTPGHSFHRSSDRSDFYLMTSGSRSGSPFRLQELDSVFQSSNQSSNVHTPREAVISVRDDHIFPLDMYRTGGGGGRGTPNFDDHFRHLVCNQGFSQTAVQITKKDNNEEGASSNLDYDAKELQMFVWSASTSPRSPASVAAPAKLLWRKDEKVLMSHETTLEVPEEAVTRPDGSAAAAVQTPAERNRPWIKTFLPSKDAAAKLPDDPDMPSTAVMTKLILDMVWRKLVRNPNTYSSLLGLTWALISFRWNLRMPKIIEGSITILSDAGLGMAMFSLGLFMALQPKLLACGTSMTIIGMVIRFVTSPAIMSATSIAAGLRNMDLRASIVQAALPQGIVPFVFAKEYNVHPDVLSTAVIFGMLVSLPITLLYYVLLGL
ncbi:probable auxin efflux carrier component 1b [Selaginella moellendorffii]|nr:probable auxin efflux carrier component 1b [Selaginella moellendorffii]XP_024542503.1 probable auxin efflux carrier component 1b [Selaginella moellendorffii]XP_024542505.1 probable auxin efflux carrier component 1b [Selaginella moellendorffii]|eukprot:XP_002981763.2 probable auxin efflux carrier component 1b [Selaginella moellendorffii]